MPDFNISIYYIVPSSCIIVCCVSHRERGSSASLFSLSFYACVCVCTVYLFMMKARISNRLDATETNLTANERFVFLLLLDVVGRLRGDRVSITWSKLHFFLGVFSCVLCALFCRPLTFRRKPTFSPTVERRIERYILRKENSLCVLCAHVPFLS